MQDFEYSNPVHVVFGNGCVKEAGIHAKKFGSHALLVTYEEAEFLEPLLSSLHKSLCENGLSCTDYCGASPNPTLRQAEKGVALCRDKQIDLVIGVGGGSAMDLAKAVAAGVLYDGELRDMFLFSHSTESRRPPERALPMLLIPTLPATGSEMNCTAVLTDEKSRKKSYVWAPDCLYAKVALMDPTLTAGLPVFQTACGAIDTIAHIAESYFNGDMDQNLVLQDRMQEAVIKSVLETLPRVMACPEDLEARGVMLWAASVALNGWLLSGTYTWAPMHQIGHVLSARYGATHGATLGTMIPAWMRFFAGRTDNGRYRQFAERVFGKELSAAADDFTQLLKDNGLPTGISAFGVCKEDIRGIAGDVAAVSFNADGELASNPPLTREDVERICEIAL